MERTLVFHELEKQIRNVLPAMTVSTIDPTMRLADLGANSVDRMEIIVQTLDALDLRMPLTELARAPLIGDLVTALHARLDHE